MGYFKKSLQSNVLHAMRVYSIAMSVLYSFYLMTWEKIISQQNLTCLDINYS
jgi:hypothetical protein